MYVVFFFFIFPRYFSADWIILHHPIIHMLDATIHHPPAGGCSRRNGWGRGGGGGGRGCGGTSTSSQGGSAGRKKEPPRHGGVTSASAQRNTARRFNATIQLRCQPKFSCRVSGKVSRSTRRSESPARRFLRQRPRRTHTGSGGWRRGGGNERCVHGTSAECLLAIPGSGTGRSPPGFSIKPPHCNTGDLCSRAATGARCFVLFFNLLDVGQFVRVVLTRSGLTRLA